MGGPGSGRKAGGGKKPTSGKNYKRQEYIWTSKPSPTVSRKTAIASSTLGKKKFSNFRFKRRVQSTR